MGYLEDNDLDGSRVISSRWMGRRERERFNERIKGIPNFKTEAEEREFWDNVEDIFEYLDPEKFVSAHPPVVPKTFGLHDVHFSPEMERDLQLLSRERKLSIEEMVRQLVAAGLKQQRPQPGA